GVPDVAAVDQTGVSLLLSNIATVVDRRVFYNHSAWDNNDAGNNAADDNAIATDKQALLPGHTATFANYTSYSRGINGIIVDVKNLPPGAGPTSADFVFKVGNDNNPATWPTLVGLVTLPTVNVRRGAGQGGSDRVDITLRDG